LIIIPFQVFDIFCLYNVLLHMTQNSLCYATMTILT